MTTQTTPLGIKGRLLDFADTGQIHLGFNVNMTLDKDDYRETMGKIIDKAFAAGVEHGKAMK